jgi:uncharacterized membrane protein
MQKNSKVAHRVGLLTIGRVYLPLAVLITVCKVYLPLTVLFTVSKVYLPLLPWVGFIYHFL